MKNTARDLAPALSAMKALLYARYFLVRPQLLTRSVLTPDENGSDYVGNLS